MRLAQEPNRLKLLPPAAAAAVDAVDAARATTAPPTAAAAQQPLQGLGLTRAATTTTIMTTAAASTTGTTTAAAGVWGVWCWLLGSAVSGASRDLGALVGTAAPHPAAAFAPGAQVVRIHHRLLVVGVVGREQVVLVVHAVGVNHSDVGAEGGQRP